MREPGIKNPKVLSQKVIQINPTDNLLVALQDLEKGEEVVFGDEKIRITTYTPSKHKFTTQSLHPGDSLYMYGVRIGKAKTYIERGEVITTKNVKHDAEKAGKRNPVQWQAPDISKWKNKYFLGYPRKDGTVGTANFWLVIPLVFCESRNIQAIRDSLEEKLGYSKRNESVVNIDHLIQSYQEGKSKDEILNMRLQTISNAPSSKRIFKHVDGIKFLFHEGGCGGIRKDADTLCELLAGYVDNPNVAGATVLSLGCQNAEVDTFLKALEKRDPERRKPVYILEQQKSHSEREFISEAVKKTFAGLMQANEIKREKAPLSKLVLGLECGGSDGFSGISANPTLGFVSDLVVALGGTTVLAEFPELHGVEQNLLDRCANEELALRFTNLMETYAKLAEEAGSGFEANPSPGNIKDGLITDAMKSAGAAKKGGTSPVVDVLDYTQRITSPGLNLLCTPGNDVESTTGLAGSGTNLIVFTTGLGTPTGNPVCPVVKVSSNSSLSDKMADIIDFDTGTIISGEDTIESKGEELLDYLIKVASGEVVPNATRLGQNDFIPWKRGISL